MVSAYRATVDRIEPHVAMIDRDWVQTSIAISLKRIADVMEKRDQPPASEEGRREAAREHIRRYAYGGDHNAFLDGLVRAIVGNVNGGSGK